MEYKDVEPTIKQLQKCDDIIYNAIKEYIVHVKKFHALIRNEIARQVKISIPTAVEIKSILAHDPECPQTKHIIFTVTIDGEPEHISFKDDDKYYHAIFKNEFIKKCRDESNLFHFRFVGNKKV